jgi:hypothetical protein
LGEIVIISVINHTNGKLTDEEIQCAIRAINRQIAEDFEPYWHFGGMLRLEGKTGLHPDKNNPAELRGDAILYIWDKADIPDALGYHDRNNAGIPYSYVFLELVEQVGEKWTVTMSHEALELIADPQVNLLVSGPHPSGEDREVFHWFEMCDAVQDDNYKIDNIAVANFVLPLYFTTAAEFDGRNDFLGKLHDGKSLQSFGTNPGGYVGFYDPQKKKHDTYTQPRDTRAAERKEIKIKASVSRRGNRRERQSMLHGRNLKAAVLRQIPEFEGFVLQVGASGMANSSNMKKAYQTLAEHVVERCLGANWKITPSLRRADVFDVTPPTKDTFSPEEAWKATYCVRADYDVAFAEPLFACLLGTPSDHNANIIGTRASFSEEDRHLQEAIDDCQWSLKQIKALEAWAVRPNGGRSHGEGILIAHPDTGYFADQDNWARKIWSNGMGTSIRNDVDWDLLNDDNDAQENYDPANQYSGHGTRTGSVIVSPFRSPLGNGVKFVSGIAPAAQLAPIKTSKSVILWSMKNLRRAIEYATENHCHVISISMGGLWSRDLHRVIQQAVDEGLIVLAAAGNHIGFVVFPAAYDEVIAVAATNVLRKPWSGSSYGPAVDIAAPGESVWRTSVKIESGQIAPVHDMGSGTSYAVATVAGVAALWLAHHGRDSLITRYGKSSLAAVFKQVLMKQGCDLDQDWSVNDFGAGIVNAYKVLQATLPEHAPAQGMRTSRAVAVPSVPDQLEAFTRLFPKLPQNAVRAGLLDLLDATDANLSLRLQEVGEELAFHLCSDTSLHDEFKTAAMLSEQASINGARSSKSQGITFNRLRDNLKAKGATEKLLSQTR